MSASTRDRIEDEFFMAQALKEARKGRFTVSPNPAVGCVLVRDGRIIGRGYHHRAGEPHAEIMALNSASGDVAGCVCYVTLEPCSHYGRTPPCALALCAAGVRRVVIATADPNPKVAGRGIEILKNAGIEVSVGTLAEKAFNLNRAFFRSVLSQRPLVSVKFGMSLDSCLALASGESKWITNAACRRDVQRMRLRADAVISSATTVITDDARLSVRHDELPEKVRSLVSKDEVRQPLKVVIDSKGDLCDRDKRADLALFAAGASLIVRGSREIFDDASPWRVETLEEDPDGGLCVKCLNVPFVKGGDGQEHASLDALIRYLGSLEMRSVLVEAGPRLSGAFIEQDLCDECSCHIAPVLLGSDGKKAFGMRGPERLRDARRFDTLKIRRFEDNVRLTLRSAEMSALRKEICAKLRTV